MLIDVPLSYIDHSPWQTRAIDPVRLQELANDIAANGLIQPVAGRMLFDGQPMTAAKITETIGLVNGWPYGESFRVQLAVGHHRLEAVRLLEWSTIPVHVAPYTDQQMAVLAWSENYQRKDLSAVDEARAMQRVMEDFGWSQREVADAFGLARPTVANKLRLLELPDDVVDQILAGAISERQALALLPVFDLPAPARQVLEAPSRPQWEPNTAKLVKMAASGESSDRIRGEVERAVHSVTVELARARFPLDEDIGADRLGKGIQAARCSACRHRLGRGKEQRCGDPRCFETKDELWRAGRLAAAAEILPLAPLPSGVESWRTETFAYTLRDGAGADIVAAGCPRGNLQLAYDPVRDDETPRGVRVEGFPDVRVVCNKGGKACYCLQKWERQHGVNAAQSERQQREREVKRRFREYVQQPAAMALSQALATGDEAAWKLALTKLTYNEDFTGLEWAKVLDKLASKAIDGAAGYYWGAWEDLAGSRAKVDALLAPLGIQPDYPELEPAGNGQVVEQAAPA